jgi:diacylglycerol kinase family enzyme
LLVNGEDRLRRTPFVLIGNNEYRMEGLAAGERVSLTAGKLSVYLTRHRGSRWGLLRLAAMTLMGKLREAKEFEALTTGEILIETRHRRLKVALDGEVTVMDTPLLYRVRPQALRVIVPAPAAANAI